MTRAMLSAGLIAVSWCGAFGQSVADRPAFEVASVKPGNPDSRLIRSSISPGGRLNAGNVTLRTLIEDAYQLKPFQLTGGPRWLDADKFEVIAKGADAASEAQIRLMLQSLLAERFQLGMHRETKEQNTSVLLVKGQPKLQPAKEGERFRMATSTSGRGALSNHVAFKNTSMAKLESRRGPVEFFVVDRAEKPSGN